MKTPDLRVIADALQIISSVITTSIKEAYFLEDNWYSINMNWDLNIHFVEMHEGRQPHLVCDLCEYDWEKKKTNTQEWYTVLDIQWEKEWNP